MLYTTVPVHILHSDATYCWQNISQQIFTNKQRQNLENRMQYSNIVLLRLKQLRNRLLSCSQLRRLVAAESRSRRNWRAYRVVVTTSVYKHTYASFSFNLLELYVYWLVTTNKQQRHRFAIGQQVPVQNIHKKIINPVQKLYIQKISFLVVHKDAEQHKKLANAYSDITKTGFTSPTLDKKKTD